MYRLTLVKGWNAEEMDNYAALVQLGEPDFIEIKGVTFCGSSKGRRLRTDWVFSDSYEICHILITQGTISLCRVNTLQKK